MHSSRQPHRGGEGQELIWDTVGGELYHMDHGFRPLVDQAVQQAKQNDPNVLIYMAEAVILQI